MAPPPRPKYLSDRDTVTLEDESGRISLTAESSALIRKQGLVTGVVCALLGREGDKGEFEVLDVCYPEWSDDSDSASIPRGLPITSNSRRYVALVSGLNVSHKDSSLLNSELLVDFLSGGLGSSSSRIVRTIIAGNSVGRQPALFSGLSVSIEPGQSTTRTKKTAAQAAAEEANNPLKVLDALLSGLAANMEIDIMPGEKDPATYSMPQQHMLPALLPHTTRYTETVSMRTNPYECELEGCRWAASRRTMMKTLGR